MDLVPFEKVSEVPTGQQTLTDILANFEFIDVAEACILSEVKGTRKPYYTGLSAYMLDASIKYGFYENYKIESIEFRRPFDRFKDGLFYKGIDLFLPTLRDVQYTLTESDIDTNQIDVGLAASDLGLSFFSSEFETDLDVRLDAITIHFSRSG